MQQTMKQTNNETNSETNNETNNESLETPYICSRLDGIVKFPHEKVCNETNNATNNETNNETNKQTKNHLKPPIFFLGWTKLSNSLTKSLQ